MESFISISMRKSLRSSSLIADFQNSLATDQRARAGLQAARLEVGTKTFQTRHKWKKKLNTLQVHPKPGGYHNTRSRGHISCKVQFSDSDTVSQTNVSTQPPFPPPQPQIGSPLLWIGVGVGISIIFSWAARRVQGYAMQQALKSMMQQTGQSGNPFVSGVGGSAFGGLGVSPLQGMAPGAFTSSPGSSFGPSAASSTVDVMPQTVSPVQTETEVAAKKPPEIKKSVYTAFTDVDISSLGKEDQQGQEQFSQPSVFQKPSVCEPEVVDGNSSVFGASPSESETSSSGTGGKSKSFISIEMLETMLDDPKIQQMVFPYLPVEMRDPVTFKQMIQLPQVRQQLQEALNNMGGEDGLDMLKYMNSDVVKQQFEQIGLTPEEVVGKILASPDIATSLQNPKVVEAIMDCSQNPLNITKYQHDTEVMNALMKIAELFPGAAGSPN